MELREPSPTSSFYSGTLLGNSFHKPKIESPPKKIFVIPSTKCQSPLRKAGVEITSQDLLHN